MSSILDTLNPERRKRQALAHLRPDGAPSPAILRAVLRSLAVFALLGLALFVADRQLLRASAGDEPIVIRAERVAELRRLATARSGREPRDEELAALLRAEVEDRLLLRAARELGLDRDDPVIFRRLVQNMRFAGAEDERTDASLFEEAVALGMDRSDPVVRRRLVQRMRLLIEARALAVEPSEDELRARYEQDTGQHVRAARVRIKHLYFEASRRERAEQLLQQLAASGAGPDAPAAEGEPFLHPPSQPLQSQRQLADRFGPDFAAQVFGLPVGRWSGPVASAYGAHLVFVHQHLPEETLPFQQVRDSVRYALLAERRAEALASALAELRARVRVEVESGAG
jgi:parvulin-like peptidyl-prolyl isomerase